MLKKHLQGPSATEELSDYIHQLHRELSGIFNPIWDENEIGKLVLSALRSNDFNTIRVSGRRSFVNDDAVKTWCREILIPSSLAISIDDVDIVRLLLFSIEITHKMFAGGTRATVTQKGFRDRRRTFESILADQFVGKLGEVVLKKYLKRILDVEIDLDWEISTEIERTVQERYYRGRNDGKHKVVTHACWYLG